LFALCCRRRAGSGFQVDLASFRIGTPRKHAWREVVPGARVVVLEGSGHWPFADDSGTVAQVVVLFPRRVMGHDADGTPAGVTPESA
jgi:hypothetical protein